MQNKNRSVASSQLGAFVENVAHELDECHVLGVCGAWKLFGDWTWLSSRSGSPVDWLVWTLLTSCWISKEFTKPMLAFETMLVWVSKTVTKKTCFKTCFLKDEMSFFEPFLHIHLQQETKLFSKITWYRAKTTFFGVIAANRPIFFLTCLFSPHKTPKKHTIWTGKQNSSPCLPFFSFPPVCWSKKQTNNNYQEKEDTSVLRECRLSPMPNLLISGNNISTFLASSSFFSLSSSVSACNYNKWGKKTSGIETNLKQHQPNESSRQKNCLTWRWQ